jgi:tryptophan 2,3-dioxygenase
MEKSEMYKVCPASLAASAEQLQGVYKTLPELIVAIRKFLISHAERIPEDKQRQPKSIIESRFTPAEEAFAVGMISCGAMANMATAILRHLGYEVKLVHGESEDSVDHAWIAVRRPPEEKWVQYDLTQEYIDIPDTHREKRIVNDWSEIREQIDADHKTLRERRDRRGL